MILQDPNAEPINQDALEPLAVDCLSKHCFSQLEDLYKS